VVRRLTLLALVIFALAAAPAQADLTVANVKAEPTGMPPVTKAGGHPDFTLSFDLGGSESIKDLDVNLPAGLLGNPNTPGKCTAEQFDSGSCPPESQVGEQSVTATILLVPTDVPGKVYNLVPDKGEPALLGIDLATPGSPTRLRSHVIVRPSDSGLTSTLRDIPDTANGVPIHIDRISLTLYGQTSAKKVFMTNPTSCNAAMTTLHAVGHGDPAGTADGQGSFTPTNCDALPFAPKLSASVGETGQTAARAAPPLTTIIEQAPGESATKSARVTLLTPLSPNVGALANVCTVADFNADKCPDKSIVGQAQVVTPLLATPLSGPVRIVENPDNLPKLVVYLNGLINIRLVGNIQLAAEGTETTFAGIPDVPLSRFKLDFVGGADGLVGTNEDLCKHAPSIKGEFTSHSGKTVTVTSPATVQGCAAAPGGGTAKKPIGSVSLRRLATSSPLLRVNAKRRSGGTRLRSVAVTLPGPLSYDRGTLSVGVKAAKGVTASLRGKRVLRLRTKSAKGAASIGAIVSKGALRVSPALRRRVAKHPTVTVVLRVTDVSGKAFTLRKRVAVR
jgi:hypothetical protein